MKYGECYVRVTTASNNEVVYLPSYPEEISDSTSVNWAETGIIGRSTPIYSYNSTSARSVSFSFDLHRQMPIYPGNDKIIAVEKILKTLRKAAYPNYLSSGLKPPIVTFRFGDFKINGILMNISFAWKKPIRNREYQVCTVSVTVNETPNSVRSASDIYSSMNPFNVGL